MGVEIEFAGVSALKAADLVRRLWNGSIRPKSDHEIVVADTDFGDFVVELDTRLVKGEGGGFLARQARAAIGSVASLLVPTEIAAPPISWREAHHLEKLVEGLRRAGAEGTHEAPLYAFGVHLNVEMARQEVDELLAILRAFVILAPWLRSDIGIDPSRHLLEFETDFPPDYAKRLLDPEYRPDMRRFTEDYLAENATRDRALDLLPILAHFEPELVAAHLPDEKIGARPTYHYRLPNSEIDDPRWRIGDEWRRWMVVETLASDLSRLDDASRRARDLIGNDEAFEAFSIETGTSLCHAR